jgi:hypothetical protein
MVTSCRVHWEVVPLPLPQTDRRAAIISLNRSRASRVNAAAVIPVNETTVWSAHDPGLDTGAAVGTSVFASLKAAVGVFVGDDVGMG